VKKLLSFLALTCISLPLLLKGEEQLKPTAVEREPFSVIGIRRTMPGFCRTWEVVKGDAAITEKIKALSGKFFDLGLCNGFVKNGDEWWNDYMCAVEWTGETPEGFERLEFPAITWLKFDAAGKISEGAMFKVWKHINEEYLPQNNLKKVFTTMEKYLEWDEAKDHSIVEIWIPIALKQDETRN